MAEKKSVADKFTRRFYLLNICVAILLFAAIFISINQFGGEAWQGRRQIGLILLGDKEEVGWNKSQYIAMKNTCDEYNFEPVILENVPTDYESCKKAVNELLKRGISTIYFSNGCKLSDMNKFYELSPKLLMCTIESVSVLWTNGSINILAFEGSYVAGVLAGLRSQTNKVGYIAPYPDSEINQEINAFTLGVQRVNPDAEVLIYWTGDWHNPRKEEQAVQTLKAAHADVLYYSQDDDTIPNAAKSAGIYFIAYNETYPENNYCLGSVTFDWAAVYKSLYRYEGTHSAGSDFALSMQEDVVKFNVSDYATTREKVAVDSVKWEIKKGRIIFMGDIYSRSGEKKCSANEAISLKKLICHNDWLIKGVRIVGN